MCVCVHWGSNPAVLNQEIDQRYASFRVMARKRPDWQNKRSWMTLCPSLLAEMYDLDVLLDSEDSDKEEIDGT